MGLKKVKKAVFKFKPFSKKQKKVLTWWMEGTPVCDKDGLIADGSIRSGKTLSLSLSFVIWAMESFDGQNFGMCGKTIGSFRRNVLFWLKLMLKSRGYRVEDKRADNLITVTKNGITNYFYIFGGKDERSQDLIQGITLAGLFCDEVVLMPESFVNQATGRCSVDGSKYWFSCNPEGPYHWFKINWIDKSEEKNMLYLHFTMDDNLSLSERVKERYKRMYSGVFYDRYIRGLWVVAEGIIYSMFSKERHVVKASEYDFIEYNISIDYGTQNPTAFGLWGKTSDGKHVMIKEYYHSGRTTGTQKTDVEYSEDLMKFTDGYKIKRVIIDPSAASFIAQLKKDGFKILRAKNSVLDGIRLVASLLNGERILFDESCIETFKEFNSYLWDEKSCKIGEDKPIKEWDHSMDQIRYYCNTVIAGKKGIKILTPEGRK